MKRYSGLHDKLCTIENIEVADDNARKNKNKKYGINKHDKNRQYENEDLVDKLFNLKRDLRKYPNETTYCLKLDIKKFYPSIPHNGLKECIRKKIKDKDFLMILDEIIDSTDNVRDVSSKLTNKIGIGVPINFKITKYD